MNLPPILLLLILSTLFLTSHSLFDPIIQSSSSGRQIWDLYAALDTDVMGNAQDWTVASTGTAISSRVFTCKGSAAYVGRNGVVLTSSDYMQRHYTGLPTHATIYYSIDLVAVDTWGPSDSFSVAFDGRVVSTWKPADYAGSYGENLCGDSKKNDVRLMVVGKLAHTPSDLTLKITLTIQSSSNVIGLGVQDASFSISTATDTEETHICPKDKCVYPSKVCNTDKYLDGSSCSNCNNNCKTCYGSGEDQCYKCADGYSYDGTKCKKCQTDCVLCTTNTACDRCRATKYLDFDGTCKAGCSSASTSIIAGIGTIGYCITKCPTGQYMMPDFTCSGACPAPLVPRTTASKGDFCDYICDQTLGLYLYWNGSCLPKCPYAPRVTYGVSFCDACAVTSDYMYQNGTCMSTCAAGYTSNTVNGSQFCKSSCVSPSYLYQNGSCAGTCQSLFSIAGDGTFLYCNYPCASGEYLYQNQSCLGACESGFVARTEGTYQFCTSPCVDLSKFLYDGGSCHPTCPSPLVVRQESIFKFCDKPCAPADYFYQNGTCSSYCQQYFNPGSSNGVNICDYPCGGSQYLYLNNGSCLGTCDFPYRSTSISGDHYCQTPCAATEYLYITNGSCLTGCPSPMVSSIIDTYNLCKDPPPPVNTVEEQANKTADLMNSAGKVAGAGMAALSVVSPSNPSSTTAGSVKQMLEYLRYLNISRSDKLEAIFQVSGSDAGDFIPDPEVLAKVKNNLYDQSLPYMFQKYSVHSSFIVNFGDKIVLLLILTTALGVFMFLDYSGKWIRNSPILRSAIKKIKITLQNYVLGGFYEQYGQIIFYTCLDIMSYSNEGYASLSITVGICGMCAGIPLIYLSFWIVKTYQEVKERPGFDHEEKEKRLKFFEEKYKGISLLFEDFNEKSFNQQAFLFYSVLRSCFFNVIVVFLYLFPMVQILLILTLNICMLTYILFKRPLKSWVELLQQICFEVTVLVVGIGFLIMAIIERTDDKYLGVREKCSDVVIVFNIIYTFLPLAFLGLRTVVSGWEFFHFVRGMYLKSKQPVQKKGYSKALKHTPPQLAHQDSTMSEILHLENSQFASKSYKASTGDESSLNISRRNSLENRPFYNQNKSFQGSPQIPIGLNSSSPIPSPNPRNNLAPYHVNIQPEIRPSRNVDNGHVVLSAQPYLSPQFTYPSEAYNNSVNSRRTSHQSNNNLSPDYKRYPQQQLRQNTLNVNLTVNYNQQGGNEMSQIRSPQGLIANGMKINNRVRRPGGKIKMPT